MCKVMKKIIRYLIGLIIELFFRFKLSFNRTSTVIVLTYGKVGSSSIKSFISQNKMLRVLHVHYLSESGLITLRNFHEKRWIYPSHYYLSKALLRKDLSEITLVTVTRDLIAREMSNYFQNKKEFKDRERLKEISSDWYLQIVENFDEWWHSELKPFGVPHYSNLKFETGRILSMNINSVKLILLRLEDFTLVAEDLKKEFNLLNSIIQAKNVSNRKPYATEYTTYRSSVKLHERDLNALFDTDYYSTFYSDRFTDLRQKWL